jgi:RHS repeat-associated protein
MDILFDPITYRGDFNGDGNEDILNIIEERIWTYLGYYGPVIRQHSLNYWDGKRFNKSDLNSIVPNYINYDHAVDSTNYHCNSYNYIADFNGDNKDDILEYNIYTRVNANQDTVYDYEYVICMPKSNGYAKFYSKRINDGDIDFSNYLIGTPLLDDHHHYSLEGGIENILKYNYDKNSFHSVSLSNKFDLTSQGRAGLYVNGKYLTFFDPKDNCKMKELYDGFGNKLEISYNHIVNDEVYTRKSHYVKNPDQSDNTQLRYINFGIEVVDSVKSIQATDTAMNNTITYKYSGAVYDRINKGFLGFDYFKSQMVTDVNRQLTLTNETIKNIFEAKAADTIRPPWYSLVTTMTRTNRPALPTADTTAGSETLSSYAKQDLGNGRFFIYAESLEDVNYNLKTRKVIFPTYNNNHQILTKRVVNSNLNFGDSVSSYIETTSYNNVAGLFGIISQVNQKNITKWQHDDASATKYTRQVNYHYYGADNNYLLKYILYDENLPQFTVCAGYSYDEYGNVLTMTQADSSNNTPILQTNQSSVEYDDLGRFPTNMTDIYGYTSYFDINYLGQPVSETDIQGNVINYHYDNMGNLEKTTFVNSLNHNITEEEFWLWGNTSCPEIKTGVYPLFQIISHTTLGFNGDTIYSFSYFDSWGREVMSKSRYMDSYDGTTPHYNSISNASVYYSNGQLQTEYDLYDPTVNNLVNNLPTRSSVPTYDAQGRMSQVNTIIGQDNHFVGLGYNGTNLSYSYGQNGNTNNQITTERTVDASGNFKNKIDALDNTVTAKYYHSGMVKETQLNTTGNKVVLSYDEIGRKKRMKDPDAGVFKYSYDVYGNMVEEIDSLISKTIYIYDVFQRDSVIRCYKYLGGSYNQLESQTNYYYNGLNANGTPSDGIGQIKRIKYLYDRTIDGRKVIDHYKKFNYNNKGLLINTIDTIREIDKISPFNSHDLIFKEEYIYDEYDRLITKKLPSISGTEGYGIELHYTYNKLDEVIKIEKYNGSGYEQVWQLAEENIYGNPVRVNLGPITNELSTYYTYNDQQMLTSKETKLDIVNKEKWELEWDVFFGNLTIRNYSLGSSSYYHEKYIYDKLDRLSDSYYGPTELPNFDSFTMDLNNFNYKKKTGYYFYEYVNDENDYSEAITLAASNAVKQIQPEWNNLVNSDVKPTHQELSYTSFNSIESISETFNRSTTSEPDLYTLKKEFYYGSGGQRVLMISLEDGVEVSRKYYTDEFEYTVDPLGNTKEVTFINSPTGLIAADVNYSNQTDKFYFVLTDQLGSITQLLKSNGDTVGNAQFTYDAWGRLRDVVNNPNSPYTPNTPQQNKFCILDRGYTGHEHLLEHDIINMNGRIYDPITAQFMQADNYIQSPEDYISYNRYAYCRYNPFKYVDPSGEDPEGPPGLTMPPTTVVGQTVKDDADDPDNFVNRDGMYPTNSIFYAGYGPPVILWGLSGLTSRGIGFTGSSNGGGSSYSTATLGNKYADDGWPKMPSDHLNQVSNSTGRRSTYSYNDFRNDAHIMLDAAGLVYDPIDVAHGLWYAYEGEYFKAGVCVFSAAPVIGIVVTSAKWAKGLKYADEAGEGIEKSFKLLDAKYLKKIGIDPHSLKKEFLGKKAQIKYYDIFKDTKTNELLIFRKGGKGTPIKTGEFIIK